MTEQTISLEQLKQQAEQGSAAAQFQLGAHLLQQNNAKEAFEWLGKSADQDFPRALDLMGAALLAGYGVKPDAKLAFSFFQKAAQLGDRQALYRSAELMYVGVKGQIEKYLEGALVALTESAKAGYPLALRTLGMLSIGSDDVLAKSCLKLASYSNDSLAQHSYGLLLADKAPAEAKFWFGRAAEQGLERAKIAFAKLMGEQGQFEPEEPEALRAQLKALSATLESWKFPEQKKGRFKVLASDIGLKEQKALLSNVECDYLAHMAQPHFHSAKVIDNSGEAKLNEYRTGLTANLGQVLDIVKTSLVERICQSVEVDVEQAEGLAVIHYGVGQEYKIHGDYLPKNSEFANKEQGGQRIRTCLVYLNDDFEGGATYFPNLEQRVTAETGKLLTFENSNEQGEPLLNSLHAGEPIVRGQKWLASLWIREHKPASE